MKSYNEIIEESFKRDFKHSFNKILCGDVLVVCGQRDILRKYLAIFISDDAIEKILTTEKYVLDNNDYK